MSEERVIRVFVSSTFRDMAAERDMLVKRAFPALRKLCEARGVSWSEVDLRWGITDEQAAEGAVLPICLAEIRNCRPYFIGLLGERYGWVPERLDPAVVEREPWLAGQAGSSITELEILHGVLNDPEMSEHAFFYLRDPQWSARNPEWCEHPDPEEVVRLGEAEAERRAAARRAKLRALKDRLRHSGFPVREDFRGPEDLSRMVLDDLTAVIERLFPAAGEPDALMRERILHEAFARSRLGVYIEDPQAIATLDAQLDSPGEPVVVIGESGSGKSALLANWAWRRADPDELVVLHFAGASPASGDWASMVRRLIAELGVELEPDLPDDPALLRRELARALTIASERHQSVVVVIDALDKLEDRDGALDLAWLPLSFPANVHLVLSTLPGRPLEELRRRRWPMVAVRGLTEDDCRRLIARYLAQYRKTLSESELERIVKAPQARNPLFLRTLLEELRLYGDHETLSREITRHLAAPTVADLYEQVLNRCEQDYDRDRPGLVRDSMSLLWAARHGVSEAELLELLGSAGQPLPAARWAPLHLALEASLVSRAGLLSFAHDFLRTAVADRYLPREAERQAAHLRLAEFFRARDTSRRQLEELPWQLASAAAWERLADVLAQPPIFTGLCASAGPDVRRYWAQIEGASALRVTDVYAPVIDHPGEHPEMTWPLSWLLRMMGYNAHALGLNRQIVERCRKQGDPTELAAALGNEANTLQALGDYDTALERYREEEDLCLRTGNLSSLSVALGSAATVLYKRGDLDGAEQLLERQEAIIRRLGDRAGLAGCVGNQALVRRAQGDIDGALVALLDQERLCREVGDVDGLLHAKSNRAIILQNRGDLDGAIALYSEAEATARELGDRGSVANALGNHAGVKMARGDLDGALALMGESERLYRELGNRPGLTASLGNQAVILRMRGELDRALAVLREQEKILREHRYLPELAICLGAQGEVLHLQQDRSGALERFAEKERIAREIGDPSLLAAALASRALVHEDWGDFDGALQLLAETERIARALGDQKLLAAALGNRGEILMRRDEDDAALELFAEVERICRAIGYPSTLANALGNQARIVGSRGELEHALALNAEEEQICRTLGNPHHLASALLLKTRLLAHLGRTADARQAAQEASALAGSHGLTDLAVRSSQLISALPG